MSNLTPKAILTTLEARDGRRSAWTGNESDTLVPQHAQDGMGDRKSKHRLSNVVWLESEINGLIEPDPGWQSEAVARCVKINGHDQRLEEGAFVPRVVGVRGYGLSEVERGVVGRTEASVD